MLTPPPIDPIEQRISKVGADLAQTFRELLDALPGAPHRPQMLARFLGVNTILTSRLLRAVRQKDALAALHRMPGPEPLRRLIRAAEKKGVPPARIREAEGAVDRFRRLIDVDAGDRSALDAIISGWLPGAREKVELIAKQSVFRGVSQLLGVACEVEHSAFILHPNAEDPQMADSVSLTISQDLRRVRPGDVVKSDTVHSPAPMFTVTGRPLERLDGLLLERFCSQPLPRLQVRNLGDKVLYTVMGEGVGVRSGVTLVHATYHPKKKPIARTPDQPGAAHVAIGIATPARTLIFDVLVHESIYPGQEPSLNVYRTAGVFTPRTDNRDVDRIDVLETVRPLGTGIARFRSPDTPSYQDIIRYVCEQRAWDASSLRGYRARIEYPMYSSEIVLSFETPIRGV